MRVKKKYKKGGKVKAVKAPPTDPPREEILSKATEKRDIDYMPSIQPQRLDSIDSKVRSKNPYFGNKDDFYLPLDFSFDWLDSEMYKGMMDGKESLHEKIYVEPKSVYDDNEETTQRIAQKFGYKPGLNSKVSITDARKENLSRAKVEQYGKYDVENIVNAGEQMAEDERDSDGNIINQYPLVKMQNPEAKSYDGGFLDDVDFSTYLSTLAHELSHASDTNVLMYDADPLFYKIQHPNYYKYRGLPIPEGYIRLKSRFGSGRNNDLIPQKDIDLIGSFVDKNKEINFKDNYPEFTRTPTNWRYFTKPTEVRARLNSQRYILFREGLFNPFTQKMNQETLDKVRGTIINNPSRHFKGMKELFNHFSDDQIIEMFNSIAMDEDRSGGRTFNFA